MNTKQKLNKALNLIDNSDNVLIAAGAGMSQELGLQTYWTGSDKRYGGAEKTKYGYSTIEHATEYLWYENKQAQLEYYEENIQNIIKVLNQNKTNHYTQLLEYLQQNNKNYWIVTTNIDTAFQYYGYQPEKIYEQHGNLFLSQCLQQPKTHNIFPTTLPNICPTCGSDARPNTLFFNDLHFNTTNKNYQQINYETFEDILINQPQKSVTLELGAGNTIANIRNHTLRLNGRHNIPAIRINPHAPEGLDGLSQIIPQSKTNPIIEFRTTAKNFIQHLK